MCILELVDYKRLCSVVGNNQRRREKKICKKTEAAVSAKPDDKVTEIKAEDAAVETTEQERQYPILKKQLLKKKRNKYL